MAMNKVQSMNNGQDLDENVLTLIIQNKQLKDTYQKMKMHVSNYDVNNCIKMILMVKELSVDYDH